MIYKDKFELKGTAVQIGIVLEALDAIKFPFERLTFPKNNGRAIIGWAKLNGQLLDVPMADLDITFIPDEPTQISQLNEAEAEKIRGHAGDHPATDDDTEPLTGEINGRKYTLGVFYPSTGNMYIDVALVNYPHLARTTVSAEVAHAVDEFMPMTYQHRHDIKLLLHNGSIPAGHNCRWWEDSDYSREYYDLVGEAFMALFTYAYSDLPFDGVESFSHTMSPDMGAGVRKVLDIHRTDYVAPAPAPEPVPAIPAPDTHPFMRFPPSKIYHKLTHYPTKTNGVLGTDTTGLTPCKTCFRAKKAQKKKATHDHRSSKSGRFVNESYMRENLATTQSSKRKGGRKKK
jgi:hypothetical protein